MIRAALQAAFRDAAAAIDPEPEAPDAPDARHVLAWLTVQSVRTQPRWVAAAEHAVQAIATGARAVRDPDVADWIVTCCAGWVHRASGPFRATAEQLLPRLPALVESVPALLAWWRITGRLDARDRALALCAGADEGLAAAVALRGGWLATADDALRHRAVAALSAVDGAPSTWPVRADLTPDFAADPASLAGLAPSEVILATAPLAATPLHLDVLWFIPEELAEGPMAEAATYPWPAMRLRFVKLPHRDQIRFEARLGDGPVQELEDAGVVAAWLEEVARAADRGPLLDGAAAPRARRRGGLRRR